MDALLMVCWLREIINLKESYRGYFYREPELTKLGFLFLRMHLLCNCQLKFNDLLLTSFLTVKSRRAIRQHISIYLR
jgi:hypothetical protein